jgi:ectoine hydroxylase-related dioxygenase (phytanoyl-CoA dioxygenase family)
MIDFDKEIISFDSEKYDLEQIHITHKHLLPSSEMLSKKWPYNENSSDFHSTFYQKLNEPWEEIISLYENFVSDYVAENIGEEFLYQKFPTFRVHLPDMRAVTKWHYDADQDHAHPIGEINFIIPLTDMLETNAVWCESHPHSHDYQPMNIKKGELLKFNGNRRHHGNKPNTTGKTRFSFDFRVLPTRFTPAQGLHPETFGNSAIRGQKWEDGGYYKKFLL